jgi:2'-5' RNA ligase
MRLFLAIEFPDDILRQMEALSRDLMARIPDPQRAIRWVKPDQFHLTLKFIGECPDTSVAKLKEAMDQTARRHESFGLGFRRLGSFKSGQFLRVLWLGTEDGTEAAKALASDLEESCQAAGSPRDERPYHPHLTLARSKGPLPASMLDEIFAAINPKTIGPVFIEKLSLIQSILSPHGPRYTTLYTAPFTF